MSIDSLNPKKKEEAPKTPEPIPMRFVKGLADSMRYIDPRFYKKLFEEDDDEEKNFYKSFFAHQFILRDHLAIDRTMLANESTLLSYIRTGLAICAAGGTILHFATTGLSDLLGGVLITAGIVTFIIGSTRYHTRRTSINVIRHKKDSENSSG